MARHPLAVIDGDVVLHRALQSNMFMFDGDEVCNLPAAQEKFENLIIEWTEKAGCHHHTVLLSDYTNFRKALNPSYKSHRGEKPDRFYDMKDWVIREYGVLLKEGLEADDLIGIELTRNPNTVSVSIDKDMLTIPGSHYNPVKDTLDKVSEEEANLFWLRQSIMGDPVDGYPGIPGKGRVAAAKALHTPAPLPVLWRAYLDTYEKAGLTEEDAVLQARMARILRTEDYDEDSGAVVFSRPADLGHNELPLEYRRTVSPRRVADPPRVDRAA